MLVYSVLHLPNPREVSMENLLSKFKLQIEVLLERNFFLFLGGGGRGVGAWLEGLVKVKFRLVEGITQKLVFFAP